MLTLYCDNCLSTFLLAAFLYSQIYSVGLLIGVLKSYQLLLTLQQECEYGLTASDTVGCREENVKLY